LIWLVNKSSWVVVTAQVSLTCPQAHVHSLDTLTVGTGNGNNMDFNDCTTPPQSGTALSSRRRGLGLVDWSERVPVAYVRAAM
jgi:hypothetical protein